MEYVVGVVFALFVIYKIVIGLGRKNAKDALVSAYGLNRAKLDQLSDPQITSLTFSLDSFARRGEIAALNELANKYR
jgi:hypothetical protein